MASLWLKRNNGEEFKLTETLHKVFTVLTVSLKNFKSFTIAALQSNGFENVTNICLFLGCNSIFSE